MTIAVEGLAPESRVELRLAMESWVASATFVTGDDGQVRTDRHAPESGSYEGVDPDGLFWSMTSETGQFAMSADVILEVTVDEAPIAAATLVRTSEVPGLSIVEALDAGFQGQLLVPPSDEPRPVVIAFGGSEGGLSGAYSYAGELVRLGYAVLAIAYFGAPGLPADLAEVPLEYFDAAVAWVESRDDVDASRLGVIGGSRGGELALLLAARYPQLSAVIADAPSGYVWGAAGDIGRAAWTRSGESVPFIPWSGNRGETVALPDGSIGLAFTPAFRADIEAATAAELEAATIQVEEASASIAMFAGSDDQLWPACELAQVAMDRLTAANRGDTHRDELHCFEGAGHFLSVVGLPATQSFAVPRGDTLLALGGTPAAAAHAGRERQRLVAEFLAETLPFEAAEE